MSKMPLLAAGWLTTAVVAVAVVVGMAAGGFGVGVSPVETQVLDAGTQAGTVAGPVEEPVKPVDAPQSPDTQDTPNVIPIRDPSDEGAAPQDPAPAPVDEQGAPTAPAQDASPVEELGAYEPGDGDA